MSKNKYCQKENLMLNEFYRKLTLEGFVEKINHSVQIASNQDQIKTSLRVKNVVAMNFMCSIIKAPHP